MGIFDDGHGRCEQIVVGIRAVNVKQRHHRVFRTSQAVAVPVVASAKEHLGFRAQISPLGRLPGGRDNLMPVVNPGEPVLAGGEISTDRHSLPETVEIVVGILCSVGQISAQRVADRVQ